MFLLGTLIRISLGQFNLFFQLKFQPNDQFPIQPYAPLCFLALMANSRFGLNDQPHLQWSLLKKFISRV